MDFRFLVLGHLVIKENIKIGIDDFIVLAWFLEQDDIVILPCFNWGFRRKFKKNRRRAIIGRTAEVVRQRLDFFLTFETAFQMIKRDVTTFRATHVFSSFPLVLPGEWFCHSHYMALGSSCSASIAYFAAENQENSINPGW